MLDSSNIKNSILKKENILKYFRAIKKINDSTLYKYFKENFDRTDELINYIYNKVGTFISNLYDQDNIISLVTCENYGSFYFTTYKIRICIRRLRLRLLNDILFA